MRQILGLVWGLALVAGCSGTSSSTPDMAPLAGGGGDSAAGAHAGASSQAGSPSNGGASGSGVAGNSTSGGTRANAGQNAGGASGAAMAGSAGEAACPTGVPPDPGSGSCHDFTPCGGEAVGKWKVELCSDPPLTGLKTFCAEATETVTITGETDIRANHTMQSTITVVASTTLPASCVAQLGPCGVAGQGLSLLKDCTPGANGSCTCSEEQTTMGDELTYSTNGSVWTVEGDGCPDHSYYCREGNDLWVRAADPKNGRISVLHLTKL